MLTFVGAWFAKKFAGTSVKLILAGIAVVAVLAVITGGYLYVGNLQEKYTKAKAALVVEQIARKSAEEVLTTFKADQARLVANLQALEQRRTDDAAVIDRLSDQLDDLDLDQEISNDADKAARDLNARNRALNRLLDGQD